MPNTINHDDIQYSSNRNNLTLSNPAFSLISSHLPILLRTEFSFESSTLELSHQVRNRGMNTGGQELPSILQSKCWKKALQSEIRDQIFMQRILIVWNCLTKGLVCGGRGRGTNMRVIQKAPFKSEYWSFTEGRDSLCSCYHPPSASASLSYWGEGREAGQVGAFSLQVAESSRPLTKPLSGGEGTNT